MRCIQQFLPILALLLASVAFADPPADIATRELSAKSPVDDILDALDARGKGFKTFTANVTHSEKATDFEDVTTRSGKVSYQDQGDGKARIRVTFDTVQHNESKKINERVDYELIDGKLIVRNYRTRSQSTDQVIRPGEKIDLFKLGQGPFPLPIGQPKEDVYKQFAVKVIAADKDDPQGAVHIQLTPNAGTRLARKFKSIDTWVDFKSHMPVRITTRDSNETKDRTTDLSDVQVNPSLSDQDFDLGKLPDANWNVTEQPYQE